MDSNAKALWANRALNAVAALAGIGSVLMGLVAALGDVVKTLQGAGLVPNKYLGIAATLAAVGMAAAKFSKTPSQSIAAAVPPSKAPAPPSGTALVLLFAITACSLSACAELTGPGGAYLPPATSVSYCPDAANEAAKLSGVAPPYPDQVPTVDIQLCATSDTWTHFYCAVCRDSNGNLALLEPGDVRCSQDTSRTNEASGIAGFVVCVASCADPYCQ